MTEKDKINALSEKLEKLAKSQNQFSKETLDILLTKQQNFAQEINALRQEINQLKGLESTEYKPEESYKPEEKPFPLTEKPPRPEPKFQPQHPDFINKIPKIEVPELKSNLEKFIGENLINKIGILIIIIGVGIGTKYSIENNLISPLTRIILGYLTSIALLVFGMKLKKNYEKFSAVLVSGAIAIMYFMTFAAYDFYELIPKMLAFILMLFFTIFTVLASLNYNRVVIAHIGLVGAYAVPFLLSDGSGKVEVLFVYMTVINIGILIISFKKYWKSLYYTAFGLTWIIFMGWFTDRYTFDDYFVTALAFASIFFITFYATTLAYKLLQSQKFEKDDVLLILANSFIFYGIGFIVIGDHQYGDQLLGLYTLVNAVIHFGVSLVIKQKKLADKNLFHMILGLVLVFITVAVPVQLDGNWVTLVWACEAGLLFWLGRSRAVKIYEKLAYPLIILAFFSLIHDWKNVYDYSDISLQQTAFLNIRFLTGLLFSASYGFIIYLNIKYKENVSTHIFTVISYLVPAVFLFVLYNVFRLEIELFWDKKYMDSLIKIMHPEDGYEITHRNYDLSDFQVIWIMNYSLLFVSILGFINLFKLKNKTLGQINLGFAGFAMATFLLGGLYTCSELRESYISQSQAEFYQIGIYNLAIRYISYVFYTLILIVFFLYTKFLKKEVKYIFDFVLHISILWILSSELVHWMDLYGYDSKQSYKLGMSILWGIYVLYLVILGIWKNKKHVRIGAIAWFGITLIKLFLYDISHLETIAKTIVFLSLGVLLLIISFLYNKYTNVISNSEEPDDNSSE